MPSQLIDRIMRYPLDPDDVWQGAIFRAPNWILNGPGGKAYRPHWAFWVSAVTGTAFHPEIGKAPGKDPSMLLGALVKGIEDRKWGGHRPAALQVADEETAALLRDALAGTDMRVDVKESLEAIDFFRSELSKSPMVKDDLPGMLEAADVTLEQARAFADAAALFHAAEPWDGLDHSDPIEIACPLAKKGLSLATVMGSAGIEYGIAFYESREQYDSLSEGGSRDAIIRLQGYWSLTFVAGHDLPIRDHDLWEDHGFALAREDAYPLALGLGPARRVQRPDSKTLAYFEALLRALAVATDDEMDSGRWEKTVATSMGPTKVALSLPDLLQPRPREGRRGPVATDHRALEVMMAGFQRFAASQEFESIEDLNAALKKRFAGKTADEIPSQAATPAERAQDLAYKAFDATGRMRIKFAREAVAIDPECADAYVILAERAGSLRKKKALYSRGVLAGQRTTESLLRGGLDRIEWADIRCRPYMRARIGLVDVLVALEETEKAVELLSDMIRLSPEDRQGSRYRLLPLLMRLERDTEAKALIDLFPEDGMPLWPHACALLAFRRDGDTPEAKRFLSIGLKANPHLWKYLTGAHALPEELAETFPPGSREEAELIAIDLAPVWRKTPGAVEWLRACARERSAKGGKGRVKGPARGPQGKSGGKGPRRKPKGRTR